MPTLSSLTWTDWLEIAKVLLGLVATISVVLAYLAYQTNVRKINEDRVRDHDRETLDLVRTSLQYSYDALTESGTSIPPRANRLNWLTAARHIWRAKRLSQEIVGSTYKTACEEVQERWRAKFTAALSLAPLHEADYFRNKNEANDPAGSPLGIELKSALVIADFIYWDESTFNPLKSINEADILAKPHIFALRGFGWGLEKYVKGGSEA